MEFFCVLHVYVLWLPHCSSGAYISLLPHRVKSLRLHNNVSPYINKQSIGRDVGAELFNITVWKWIALVATSTYQQAASGACSVFGFLSVQLWFAAVLATGSSE